MYPCVEIDIALFAAGMGIHHAQHAARREDKTQRHAATPEQTWPDEVAKVLASAHSEAGEKRLQDALKVLLARR